MQRGLNLSLNEKTSSFAKGVAVGLVLAVLVAVTLTWSAFDSGFSARSAPSALEARIAHEILRVSVSHSSRGLVNPVVSAPVILREGLEHYADHCASCHANDGSGNTLYGRGLSPPPPDLRSGSTQSKTDGELFAIIQNGVRMTGMPAFGSPGDDDLSTWKLVLFIRHLPSLTTAEERAMEKVNPISPSELEEQKEEDQFLQGIPIQPKGSKE
jgi:mono/diheme cytochrome c family protein